MKLTLHKYKTAAFSLVEVMAAMLLLGTVFIALYCGISSGFLVVEAARENLRATQIIVEKMETIRLCNWDQIHETDFCPNFKTPYNFESESAGFDYEGVVTIEPVVFDDPGGPPSYADQMRKITIKLSWTSRGIFRTREAVTFYTKSGLQNYHL